MNSHNGAPREEVPTRRWRQVAGGGLGARVEWQRQGSSSATQERSAQPPGGRTNDGLPANRQPTLRLPAPMAAWGFLPAYLSPRHYTMARRRRQPSWLKRACRRKAGAHLDHCPSGEHILCSGERPEAAVRMAGTVRASLTGGDAGAIIDWRARWCELRSESPLLSRMPRGIGGKP